MEKVCLMHLNKCFSPLVSVSPEKIGSILFIVFSIGTLSIKNASSSLPEKFLQNIWRKQCKSSNAKSDYHKIFSWDTDYSVDKLCDRSSK